MFRSSDPIFHSCIAASRECLGFGSGFQTLFISASIFLKAEGTMSPGQKGCGSHLHRVREGSGPLPIEFPSRTESKNLYPMVAWQDPSYHYNLFIISP
ncbi:hypothetical protein TNIN_305251 [Trichonephila inaurata madagascariensis]|uniref:Uncharacterized protein n=1 Tax=Trichonephila inaurata madagascariensis TaxID=2747483 RepID=A0A8X7CI62_9ARAC|nr:hypothetical protein TNIN_305251 [Trichonephila inaurata madagascariensis]